ncbi:patatin-like phospholipase family protein [Urechidicola sp. KH5]
MKQAVFALLILCSLHLVGQQTANTTDDLKVGLVLSGGGAKGFAHVGVLKVLEEAGVRVDYIGGTSMGAMIGSLYASGYSAHEIDSIIKSIDINKVVSDESPRKSKPFYEKESGEKHALTLPVKDGKLTLPKALSKGQNLLNLLSSLFEHVDTISDFNQLPIPFLCIATDIETGKKIVLNEGFLPKAVQASGAFPTLLDPVEIGDKLLVDGGIVNNFPVDEVKKMGADVIIGVELGNDLSTREELETGVDILNQIVSFQIYSIYEENIELTDVHISPNMKGYSVTTFDKYDEIYKIGEEAARMQFTALEEIAEQQTYKRPIVNKTPKSDKIILRSIKMEGNQDYTRTYIKGKMGLQQNDTISKSEFYEGINNLFATGNFTDIQYQILDHEESGSVVQLKLKQNEVNTFVKLAGHYDDLYKTAVLINLTTKHLLIKNDVLSVDLILGDNIRYNFDYFIDNGSNWSFGFKSRFNRFNTDVNLEFVPDINMVDLKYRDFTNQLYVQNVLNRKFAIGIGAEHKQIKSYTETFIRGQNSEDEDRSYFDKSDYLNFISYVKFDTKDKKHFPKQGAYLAADFRWYLFSSDYLGNFESFSQLKGKLSYTHTFFNKLTAEYISEAGTTIGENNNPILDYHLGGYGENFINTFISFYGYDYASLSDSGFLRSTLNVRYELFKDNYLMVGANAGRVDSDLFNEGKIFEDTKLGYSFGYGVDSFLGPIELNFTFSPDTEESFWFFNFGFWF